VQQDLLFYGRDLRQVLEAHLLKTRRTIEEFDANRLLNTNVEDLVAYFVEQAKVEPIALRESEISVDHKEVRVDVTGRFEYAAWGDERTLVPGAELTLHVPFHGEPDLFRCQPSKFTMNPPRGHVSGTELVLAFSGPQGDLAHAKRELDSQLSSVRQYVTWINDQVNQHNATAPAVVRGDVERRRQRVLEQQNLVASFGYPLKRRQDAPQTYAVPAVRRKLQSPPPPPASTAPFVPEPALDDATYEQILTVLGNMVRVMEQSPGAFAEMCEEDLRTHFLVQLNGQFEGKASGETFRGSGSTDILLVENDRSVFIAECKFWKGAASLTGALEQLLDYATWRDAKAAVLVFNRGADFSHVAVAAADALAAYPSKRGDVVRLGDTAFRLSVRHRDDRSKVMTVTVLLYNVPGDRPTSARLKPRKKRQGAA
jgi:hypothetical protein